MPPAVVRPGRRPPSAWTSSIAHTSNAWWTPVAGEGIHGKGNAAEKLGLHPNTLRSRMQKLGITRPARPS